MADAQRTVEIILVGKNELSKSFQGAKKTLEGIGEVAAPFANIADNILKVNAALSTLVAGGLALALKKFADFEDVLLKVKGIAGASAEEYAALKEQTLGLGETTRFTAKEAAEGLQFLAQAGIDLVDAQKALPQVLDLASASATDLGRTADIATNIMAGFGIEAEGLGKASDVLVSTFTGANVNLEQLGQSFKFVGPVAKSLGISFEETAATLGLLGNAGYQAEQGGTALRNILLALVAPTTNMSKLLGKLGVTNEEFGVNLLDSKNALKSLGVEVKGVDGNLRPLSEILADLGDSLNNIESPADRSATAINIFGKRGGPQLLALLEQGIPAIDKMKDRLADSEGVTKSLAEEMESGLGGALRTLNSSFDGFLLRIGEKLSDSPIRNLANIFRTASKSVSSDDFKEVYDAVDVFEERINDMLIKISKNLPDAFKGLNFTEIIDSFDHLADSISESFSAAFGGVDLSTTEGLTDAIQFIIDSLATLNDVTAGIIESWEPFISLVSKIADSFNKLDSDTKELIGNFLGASQQAVIVGAAITTFAAIISGLTVVFTGAGGAALAFVAPFAGFAVALGIAGKAAFEAGEYVGGLFNKLESIKISAQWLIENLDKVFNFTGGKTAEELEKVNENLENARKQFKETSKAAKELREQAEKETKIRLNTEKLLEASKSTKELAADLQRAADHQSITTKVNVKTEEAKQTIDQFVGYVNGQPVYIPIEADTKPAEKEIKDLSEKGELTKFQIEADLDATKIEEETKRIEIAAEKASESFKYQAEVDIAQAEAAADILNSTFDSVGETIKTSSESIDNLIGSLADADYQTRQEIKDQIDRKEKLEEEAFELQKELIEAQIENIEAMTKLAEQGGFTINVEGATTFDTEIRLIWEKIFKFTQAELNAQGFVGLLGVPA